VLKNTDCFRFLTLPPSLSPSLPPYLENPELHWVWKREGVGNVDDELLGRGRRTRGAGREGGRVGGGDRGRTGRSHGERGGGMGRRISGGGRGRRRRRRRRRKGRALAATGG